MIPKIRSFYLLFISCLLLGFVIGTGSAQSDTLDNYDADLAMDWFNLQLELVQTTPGFSPPVASRAFGYTGLTLYEALVNGMPEFQSLAEQLNGLAALPPADPDSDYHYPTVANSALKTMTGQLFANTSDENIEAIAALYSAYEIEYRDAVDVETYRLSDAYGQAIANAIFEWSMDDGGHLGYLYTFPEDYLPPEGDGLWIPTPRSNGDPQPALQPYWGENRPFVPMSVESCPAAPPPDYSEEPGSDFFVEAMEVYVAVETVSEEESDIALFWADDPGLTATPPGHSISILTQILAAEDVSLAFAAEAYARMGMAVADAFIGCWQTKYQYNLIRPISYIHKVIDPNWDVVVDTPPFPEYTSGHSVQTGAAAAILIDLFGDEYEFTDHTHDARGLEARSFTSFSEMADETALSRLYGGIHYRAAIEVGVEQGLCIGDNINQLQFRVEN